MQKIDTYSYTDPVSGLSRAATELSGFALRVRPSMPSARVVITVLFCITGPGQGRTQETIPELAALDSLRALDFPSPADSLALADAHHRAGVALLHRDRYADAERHLREGLRLRIAGHGRNHESVGVSHVFLGILNVQAGRAAEALPLYDEGLHRIAEASGEESSAYLWALNAKGSVLQLLGEQEAARSAYRHILAVRDRRGDPEDLTLAWTLHNLALLQQSLSEFSETESLFHRSYRIRKRLLGDHLLTAKSLRGYAMDRFLKGDYLASRQLFQDVLSMCRASGNPDDLEVGLALHNLGSLHYWTGDPRVARDYFSRSLEIVEEHRYPQGIRQDLRGLAQCAMDDGQYSTAASLYRRALKVSSDAFGPASPEAAEVHVELGVCMEDAGNRAEAADHFRRGLDLLREGGTRREYLLAWSLYDHGCFLLEEDVPGALVELEESLELLSRWFPSHHPQIVRCRTRIAEGMLARGDRRGAWEMAEETALLADRHLQESLPYMTERHAFLYRSLALPVLDLLLTCLQETDEAAVEASWSDIAAFRGIIHDELLRRARGIHGDGDAEPARGRLSAARQRLSNLFFLDPDVLPGDRHPALLRDAMRERERAEEEYAARRAPTGAPPSGPVELASLLDAVPKATALLAYVRYNEIAPSDLGSSPSYAAFLDDGSNGPEIRFVRLGAASAIDSAVTRLRAHMAGAGERLKIDPRAAEVEYRKIAGEVKRLLWDPLWRGASPGRTDLIPDGSVHLVAFSALPDAASGYLGQSTEFRYLGAERDLAAASRERIEPSARLLVLGDPDFDGSPSGDTATLAAAGPFRGAPGDCPDGMPSFAPLSHSRSEVLFVAALGRNAGPSGEVLELVGASATETAFKAMAPRYEVLHVATHGFFLGGCGDRSEFDPVTALRSGLVLSGANRPGGVDDGFLTAEEIGALDLSGVRLAVLSACETGSGTPTRAEGVFGLQRAFRAAGAGALVMSLWPIRDRDAERWMKRFYRALWEEGLPVAEAVGRARMETLAELTEGGRSTHPLSWGGVIAVGN